VSPQNDYNLEEGFVRKKIATLVASLSLCAALALPLVLFAQDSRDRDSHWLHHYKLIDAGTFGGPGSGIENPSSPSLNQRGMLVGVSDTSTPDPNAPDCFLDCWVDMGFLVHDGVVTPLGPPPSGAGLSSIAYAINEAGQIVGQAQNGAFDTLTGWPETHAALWQTGQTTAIDLGTLGGTQSIANVINDSGQVAGAALNATLDPFANSALTSCLSYPPFGGCGTFAQTLIFFPGATEMHAFVWTKAHGMQDLGTLGGPDSAAWTINDRGQIAGESFTSFTPNPSSGVPTIDPFFWDPKDRKMLDLGGLGGTFGATLFLNGQGQVVGLSNLPGDTTYHAFIWSKSEGMKDLGTLGGTIAAPHWMNDAGEVVGFASLLGDQDRHAFLWRNGVMTDLGTADGDPESESASINSQGQIVGSSFTFNGPSHGLIWENGAHAADLNTLVSPGTTMSITVALLINDRGEIGCLGLDPSDAEEHACLLIPCDENHPGIEGCDYSVVDAADAQAQSARINPAPTAGQIKLSPEEMKSRFGSLMARRLHRLEAPLTSPQ
jgi:probable HAF family extracellular repeat protein